VSGSTDHGEHQTDLPWAHGGPEREAERPGQQRGQHDDGHQQRERGDLERDRSGRDGRHHRQHEQARQHALGGAEHQLLQGDDTHRHRSEDAVLDLLGVAELGGQRQGHRHQARDEHGRELAAATADALPDPREQVGEHEQQRLHDGPRQERGRLPTQDPEIAQHEATDRLQPGSHRAGFTERALTRTGEAGPRVVRVDDPAVSHATPSPYG